MSASTPLDLEVRHLIRVAGPMSVTRFMQLCLAHPEHGYYTTRNPLGRDGDFITAPEISQMFGEVLGLWAATLWKQMGSPADLRLVELGPGRGTMMADMLRAVRVMPSFTKAITVHLVEINATLRDIQRENLKTSRATVTWHESLDAVPDGPVIVVANEYFDALPISQAIKLDTGWHERRVGLDDTGALYWTAADEPLARFEVLIPAVVRAAPLGSIFEWRSNQEAMRLARRLRLQGGAALIIDYGHMQTGVGDTLQAVARHAYTDPLKRLGEADLTAHVDFQALALAAEDGGVLSHGPVEQGAFLRRLGIETRASSLAAKASPHNVRDIDLALERLTASGSANMGALFKVLGLSHPSIAALHGLERGER